MPPQMLPSSAGTAGVQEQIQNKYGVLCEMFGRDRSVACYAKAGFPPDSLRDVKFMAIEERFKQCTSPQELLAALPKVTPRAVGTLFKPAGPPGAFTIGGDSWAALPKLEWFQLYNLKKTA